MSFIKGSVTGSAKGSSKGMQNIANYYLKERGEYMSAQELLDTQDKDKELTTVLQRTDIIQFKTEGFDHWGIYIGTGRVAHVKDKQIQESKLVDVASGHECRINNKVKSAQSKDLTALHPDVIMASIYKQLRTKVSHNPLTLNSEHQVTLWKYGTAFSDTVEEWTKYGARGAGAAVGGTAGFFVEGPAGIAAGAPLGYLAGEKLADIVIDKFFVSK